ncbi:MAG: gyrase subunit [Candidatus Angelobacter sp.]|jgi:DNA gyrase subunit A|nr:gyrase subunit [Candidatus Angelobacter sp.]
MADEQNPQLPLDPKNPDGTNPPGGPGAANIVPINVEDEMRRSYLDYSMSVIIGRALPDIRDGLKPVHRRILYAMHDMGLLHNKKHVKCAKVVGEGLGKYHPHGDAALYDALVRMAQPFSLRYPLIDGQGNFGSVDGDPPAAYRYTEARLTRIAEELLQDIDKDTVDFVENFDNTTHEPTVLPTRIPNLLINGSNGIAVGMATNIPPHNLTEIVTATIELVNNPATPLKDILKIVKGPDFPTGAYINGKSGIQQAYTSGRGRFMMRAKAAIEQMAKERQSIVVTEIPYQVNKARLIERIADLVNNKVIDEISDIRDESDRDGMRIVIELKRGAEPQIVLNQLYKHTSMQESFSMIFLAVVNQQPKEMGLIQAIQHFIDHRVDVVRRRTVFLLMKAREREHLLEGYKLALDNLDAVIKLIRASGSRQEAKDSLLAAKFKVLDKAMATRIGDESAGKLSAKQADAILDLQLYRLTRLSTEEILNELNEIRDRIAEYESILASEKKLRGVIVKELEAVLKEYGGAKDARRTQILDEAAELTLEDLISDEQVAVTISHSGYMKRTPISTYRQQRRGGTGRKGMSTREEDFVEKLIIASTHAYLLIFTNKGRVYWLKVYEVPDIGPAGKGKAIANLVALQPGETVRAILNVRDLEEEGKHIFFATRNGTVKKTELKDFSNVMSRGIIAIGIDTDDELVGVKMTDGKEIVFLASHEGMAIRFEEEDVRSMGRPAYGVRGMDLDKGDYIIGMAVTPKERTKKSGKDEDATEDTASLILSVTEQGYGKRTDVDEYRLQSRGGKGVINVKTTARNGKVSGIMLVDETSECMVISQFGKIIRINTTSIREAGRSTQGVRLLHLDDGDKVAAAVVIPPEEKEENGNGLPLQ